MLNWQFCKQERLGNSPLDQNVWVACSQRILTKLTRCFSLFSLVAMTTWLCVSPETTILTVTGLVVLNVVFYFLMERKHSNSTEGAQQATYKDVKYEKIPEGNNTDASIPPPRVDKRYKTQGFEGYLSLDNVCRDFLAVRVFSCGSCHHDLCFSKLTLPSSGSLSILHKLIPIGRIHW